MHRYVMLLVLALGVAPAADPHPASSLSTTGVELSQAQSHAAPEIRFRDLEWWGVNVHGIHGWYPGQDLTPMPTAMGRIEAQRITGTQEMVWQHSYYRLHSVLRTDDRTWFVGFEKGTLKLTHIERQCWQVEFTPAGGQRPTRIFRTGHPEFECLDPP